MVRVVFVVRFLIQKCQKRTKFLFFISTLLHFHFSIKMYHVPTNYKSFAFSPPLLSSKFYSKMAKFLGKCKFVSEKSKKLRFYGNLWPAFGQTLT